MNIFLNKTYILAAKIVLLAVFLVSVIPAATPAFAQSRSSCPSQCPDSCTIDISCQNAKLFNSSANCDLFQCIGNSGTNSSAPSGPSLNLFGIGIRLDSERAIQQILVLSFSLLLGGVALAGMLIGVVAAIKRADTTDAGEIAKLNKTMANAIVGVVLVVMSIVIVQLVSSAIGIGNIFSLITFDNLLPGP